MPGALPGHAETSLAAAPCPLYEQDVLRQATGDALRPGGVELTERLLARCELPAGARLLDIGCGYGASLDWLQAQQAYDAMGVDYSISLLRDAATRRLVVARAPGGCLPFPAAVFDAVLFECSLSIIWAQESPEGKLTTRAALGVLQEARRVLRPGGWFLLSDLYARRPEGMPALRALPGTHCLRNALDLRAVQEGLQISGFEICFWEDHSEALRQLGRRLCQAYGSTQAFWDQALGEAVDAFDLTLRISQARPGYFILLAQKTAGCQMDDAKQCKDQNPDHEVGNG